MFLAFPKTTLVIAMQFHFVCFADDGLAFSGRTHSGNVRNSTRLLALPEYIFFIEDPDDFLSFTLSTFCVFRASGILWRTWHGQHSYIACKKSAGVELARSI